MYTVCQPSYSPRRTFVCQLTEDEARQLISHAGGAVELPKDPCIEGWELEPECIGWAGWGWTAEYNTIDEVLVITHEFIDPAPAAAIPCQCCERNVPPILGVDRSSGDPVSESFGLFDVCPFCGWQQDVLAGENIHSKINGSTLVAYRRRTRREGWTPLAPL
jgi:hypothetical protein